METFSQHNFKEDLEKLCMIVVIHMMVFTTKLNKHGPKKRKQIKGNNKLHIIKTLREIIMKQSSIKNKGNKTKDPIEIRNYTKQHNYLVNLNKKAKFEYLSKYSSNGNKPFWVNCKPYLQISVVMLLLISCSVKIRNKC